jgi:hypothetical protein
VATVRIRRGSAVDAPLLLALFDVDGWIGQVFTMRL